MLTKKINVIVCLILLSFKCWVRTEDLDEDDPDDLYDVDADNSSPMMDDLDYYDTIDGDDVIQVAIVTTDPKLLREALANAKDTSTEGKYLPNLTLEQLAQVSTDLLLQYALRPNVIASLPDTSIDVFKALLVRLPPKLLGKIAVTPGLLGKLSDDQIVAFAKNTAALKEVDEAYILQLTRDRPEVIPKLPWQALDFFLTMPRFVRSLSRKTLKYLMRSEEMALKLEELPRSTIARLVSSNPQILTDLPKYFPARSLVRRLVHDRAFLGQISVKVHAMLAESTFRHQIDSQSVLIILEIYPRLPSHLTQKGLDYNQRYFRDQTFLNSVSCNVYLSLASTPDFVDRLAAEDLSAMAKSKHMWNCLPVSVIRNLLMKGDFGSKLTIKDVSDAAKAMSQAKSLDPAVVTNLLQFQFPDIAKNAFKLPELF